MVEKMEGEKMRAMKSMIFPLILILLFSSNIAALAFEPFTGKETELIQKKIDDAYQEAEGKETKEEIWNDWKKEMVESEPRKKRLSLDFSPHKLNYFIINWPEATEDFQVKFQISAKYQVFEGNLNIFRRNYFPLYFAYSQKSFWDVGKYSMPFEENNYNPEAFFDYRLDYDILDRFKLRDVIVSPYEHESNGLDGVQSRSWNRYYVTFLFGLEPLERLKYTNALIKDKFSLYIKLWNAYSYSDQDDYLKATGRDGKFLDYAGRGEAGISIRELPILSSVKWLKNNQLDVKTRILRDWGKESYEVGYSQNIPSTNFFLYIQYWHGYNESLLRFAEHEKRMKAGPSFFF